MLQSDLLNCRMWNFRFRIEQFRIEKWRGCSHQWCCDEMICLSSKRDIRNKNSSSGSWKSRNHNCMNFRAREMLDEWSNEHCALCISQKDVSSCVDALTDGCAKNRLQHPSNVVQNPLYNLIVVEYLYEQTKKENRRQRRKCKSLFLVHQKFAKHKNRALTWVHEETRHFDAQTFQEFPAKLPTNRQNSENQLKCESSDDRSPFDGKLVVWKKISNQDENDDSKQRTQPVKIIASLKNQQHKHEAQDRHW